MEINEKLCFCIPIHIRKNENLDAYFIRSDVLPGLHAADNDLDVAKNMAKKQAIKLLKNNHNLSVEVNEQ